MYAVITVVSCWNIIVGNLHGKQVLLNKWKYRDMCSKELKTHLANNSHDSDTYMVAVSSNNYLFLNTLHDKNMKNTL